MKFMMGHSTWPHGDFLICDEPSPVQLTMDSDTLYNTLRTILNTHTEIDELGLLPFLPTLTDIPPATRQYHPFLLVDSKLGVPLECVHLTLKGAHAVFMGCERGRVECGGVEVVRPLEEASRVIVVLNPDCYSAMNARKKLLLANHLTIPLELRLLDLIFTVPRNIKSSVPWHHRRWLLQIPGAPTPPLFNHEIALCHRAATLYPRNYYAWNHRHWIVRELIMVGDLRALRAEYDAMRAWVATNVSDHSGVQHMERCLVAIMQVDKGEEEVSTVVREHVEWVRGLVEGYPGHETMWCHLRFCTELEREIGERMGVEMEVAFARRCRVKEVGVGDDHEATERQRRLACAYELWVLRLEQRITGITAPGIGSKEREVLKLMCEVAEEPIYYRLQLERAQ